MSGTDTRRRRADHADRYAAHLERDRARSAATRERHRAAGVPNPAAVDRAISEAFRDVWRTTIAANATDDTQAAKRAASAKPISPWRVVDRAVELLVARKGADRDAAARMVTVRLVPTRKNPSLDLDAIPAHILRGHLNE
ncbi:hypothetical protein IHQ68_04520 [Chelatococcus sambhunathii]|uniref:Uncharacterized protein n=1 Tax=Chelatococcus sambhunathii TaxID=363953 RepID=A0ABU1DCU1_9HYPH|nr:hypothetical protein [Chelatococcus sambhunathii]MDR4305890.1 hypothetical protein [Chelatococcus sambhunathii]